MDLSGMDWMDNNLDGVGDAGIADTDGDGLYDMMAMDNNYDGVVDGYGYDTNRDGVLDTMQVDTDRDGVLDATGRDLTGDGVLDVGAGPASGGVEVALAQPVDPAVAIQQGTVVGGTPAGGNGHLIAPAGSDQATRDAVDRINENITDSGAIWTLPDPW